MPHMPTLYHQLKVPQKMSFYWNGPARASPQSPILRLSLLWKGQITGSKYNYFKITKIFRKQNVRICVLSHAM